MKTILAAGCAVLVALGAYSASARDRHRDDDDHDVARNAFQRGEVLPITQILAIVAQHLPGDIVEVKLDTKRDRLTYEIKVLTPSGRVRELVLDARSGAFIGIED
jgi:uncharacterized membrane protein YkoI